MPTSVDKTLSETEKQILLSLKVTSQCLADPRCEFKERVDSKLHWASGHSPVGVVHILIGEGADPNVVDYAGQTPLFEAGGGGRIDNVKALLDVGAEVGRRDALRRTALHRVVKQPFPEIVALLVEHGIPLEARDQSGRTALNTACEAKRYPDVVATLIAAGADVNTADETGDTPLHNAANDPEILRLLIDAGADVRAVEWKAGRLAGGVNDGTPLHYAAECGNAEAVALLLDAGADPELVNKQGDTPRDVATLEGYTHVSQVIDSYRRNQDAEAALNSASTPPPPAPSL